MIVTKSKKITLFDIIVGVCILIASVFLMLFFVSKDQWITIEVKGSAPDFLSKNITIGDSQRDSLGREIATIKSIRRWGEVNTQTWITVSIKAKRDKTNVIKFNYQDIAIGSPIKLQFGQYSIDGIVTYIEGVKDDRVKEEKTVKTRIIDWSGKSNETVGVFPWVANAIQKGDIMVTLTGDVVAEILSVDIQDADRIVTTADGRILTQKDPSRKDVYATIRIVTTKTDQTNFFLEDYPIKINYEFPFITSKYNISPRIVEIQ